MLNVKVNGIAAQVKEGSTVLEAARAAGVHIPTLCYLKGVNAIGACRVCLVEVKGARGLVTSCVTPAGEGMEIFTNTTKVRDARRAVVELILSDHKRECLTCVRNRTCELRAICEDLQMGDVQYEGKHYKTDIDDLSPSIVRDASKCILCRRCIAACNDVQKVHAIGAQNRGGETVVGVPYEYSLKESNCINCGQCIASCPVGALYEKDGTEAVWKAINDPDKYVVMQTAPAVRAALGEEFGMPIGTSVTGKMAAAIRRLGVDKVFDTDFAADLTIMEEGTELIDRLQNGGKLPMITSCSPGWIKFCEHNFHDMLDNLSTCKSPHEMMGAVTKSYYAQKQGLDPKKIFVVSVMPCTAKKFESSRDELSATGSPDVDAVITTRELAKMIRTAGINFAELPDEGFDSSFDGTGAAVIFGATGGVMEAALRTVYEILTGKTLEKVEFCDVRGLQGVKEATVKIGDLDVRVAVAHGTANAAKLLERVRAGELYHFIEIMGCPGGCVTGGGQPHVSSAMLRECDPRTLRAAALYSEDEKSVIRKSHEHPAIKQIYAEFLGKPGSHKSHELLHTHYVERPKFGH